MYSTECILSEVALSCYQNNAFLIMAGVYHNYIKVIGENVKKTKTMETRNHSKRGVTERP